MNSTTTAKMHYSGKQHEKHVRMFMAKLGKELPKKETDASNSSSQSKDAVELRCETCNTNFTSQLHAEQHYMSKSHKRVMTGLAPPKATQISPEAAKWKQQGADGSFDPTGRFGIGINFLPSDQRSTKADQSCAADIADGTKNRFYCDICKVSTTSQDQLTMHFNGSKHQKKVGAQAADKTPAVDKTPAADMTLAAVPAGQSLLSAVTKEIDGHKAKTSKDLSFYRTPSGQFYCQACNICLNSESQFVSHTESKKHKLKAASQKPAMPLTGPKVAQFGDTN